MMAAGLPGTAEEHAQSVTDMAFDMRGITSKKDTTTNLDVSTDLEVPILVFLLMILRSRQMGPIGMASDNYE